jgi:hypothetical protein
MDYQNQKAAMEKRSAEVLNSPIIFIFNNQFRHMNVPTKKPKN